MALTRFQVLRKIEGGQQVTLNIFMEVQLHDAVNAESICPSLSWGHISFANTEIPFDRDTIDGIIL